MEIGQYEEKPRANLQSVIQKMRDNSNGYKHVLIAAKLNEKELAGKKNLEPILTEFYQGIRDPEEDQDRAKAFT